MGPAEPSYATVARSADAGGSGLLSALIEALWFVAGAAMLVFTAFLAVLVLAGVAFRVGRADRRRDATKVFAVSSAIVVASATVIFSYDSFRGRSGDVPAGAAVEAAEPPGPPTVYPSVAGLPLRHARGGASGAGVRSSTTRALLLYGSARADAATAELSATKLANLTAHFGGWTAHPVEAYRSGEMAAYDAVLYLGASDGAALPVAFLDDVSRHRRPVLWVGGDIARLAARDRSPAGSGFRVRGSDTGPFTGVEYKNTVLPMSGLGRAGLARVEVTDPARARVLATAVRTDGTRVPWAVRSGNLVYVGEDPLPHVADENDRYLALADLLFEVLAPGTAQRHRALIRLEDVGPAADPAQLRAVVDYLHGQRLPFSVGVYPVYRDPHSADGRDVTIRLSERPAVVEALRYAASRGGTVLMHGYTHQHARARNAGTGRSGEDAEFYRYHLDEQQRYQLDGPVAEDSARWALDRIDRGLGELREAGLPRPSMFEFPHYMASPVDYVAAGQRFAYRYERALYFPGLLSGREVPDAARGWQFFPYAVRDVYGAVVVPENLGYVTSTGDPVATLLARARANLVVRDGVASFFYHPFLGVGELPRLVDGIRALGYTFVGAQDLADSP